MSAAAIIILGIVLMIVVSGMIGYSALRRDEDEMMQRLGAEGIAVQAEVVRREQNQNPSNPIRMQYWLTFRCMVSRVWHEYREMVTQAEFENTSEGPPISLTYLPSDLGIVGRTAPFAL
ncbi:MAG: hypothetical protein SNJ58_08515 [Aggregatilineales bacterium]